MPLENRKQTRMPSDSTHCPLITTTCLGLTIIPCKKLLKEYPPVYLSKMKATLFAEAKKKFHCPQGEITISRWATNSHLDEHIDSTQLSSIKIETGASVYTYDDSDTRCTAKNTDTRVWYVNFADPQLFGFYDGSLFAQDEIQTLEHPMLASAAVFLDTEKIASMPPLTVEHNVPTPYLIEQVPYWIQVNTKPVLDNGAVASIYGYRFSEADEATIRKGITLCNESIPHNIIAMSAPAGRSGTYTTKDIAFILRTALTSFTAAALRSKIIHGKSEEVTFQKVIIHTGNWGSGAFGGNRELLTLLQVISASLAGTDTIVFHGVSDLILCAVKATLAEMVAANVHSVAGVIAFVATKHYAWGTGDGN